MSMMNSKAIRILLLAGALLLQSSIYAASAGATGGAKETLVPYEGTYIGRWRLLDFRNVPYVELGEYLSEREFGKLDTLLVEATSDSTLSIRLQGGAVDLRVSYYKAQVRGETKAESVYFLAIPGSERSTFRYRSADGRLLLTLRVVGGAGEASYVDAKGYAEADGWLSMPAGDLSVKCEVESEGTFDGHAIRMRGILRFALRREVVRFDRQTRMDSRCRGCI